MTNYQFYCDRKTTIWQREYFSVSAENQHAADAYAEDMFADDSIDIDTIEDLYDTFEEVTLEENNNNATKELYRITGEEILNNALE